MLTLLQVIVALGEVLFMWRFYACLLATLLACLLLAAVLPEGALVWVACAPVVVIGVGLGAFWQLRASKVP
ncbi:MAG: hypothetical protein KF800_07315 [Lysobacter sp.]|nr:hypothetical protein [Lysobacter sp.]